MFFFIPIFPIQYATFTELSYKHKERFLLTPMKNNSVYSQPIEKCFFFGGVKKEDLTPGQTDTKGTLPPPKHVFVCIERKFQCSLSCERVEVTKKNEKAREGTTSPMPTPPCIFGGHHILRVRSDGGRIQT